MSAVESVYESVNNAESLYRRWKRMGPDSPKSTLVLEWLAHASFSTFSFTQHHDFGISLVPYTFSWYLSASLFEVHLESTKAERSSFIMNDQQ